MFIKKPTHRKFNYEPRYYNPEKDEELKENRNLGSDQNTEGKLQQRNLLLILLC